ncbi:MAG TPA: aminoglycoside phosphotransferase family protein [Methylomirabilota bacterium]|nr:aminoglycoside phosphotransferase family protein [Methylomirabilota bacterium]
MSPEVRRTEIEEELKRALPACGEVIRLQPLIKGHGHQSFVLETSSKTTLLLKIALRNEQLGKMKSLRVALELAAEHQITAPKLLYFSEGTASFAGRPWLVQEFLMGQDGEEALPGLSDFQRAAFFRDFGRAVARLHAVDAGYFTEDLASSERVETWASLVESRLDRLTNTHRQAGLLPRQSIESAGAAILSAARAVSPGLRPSLVHRDLYLPNTLVSAGRFRCLLDFEHARSADPVTDFVKLKMWVLEQVPGSESEFCLGYGVNPLLTENGRTRHRLALGLELLAGLLYWQTTGQPEMLADYQRRFEHWLNQSPEREDEHE